MAKTKRLIAENLKLVDIAAEIIDARIPLSSRNPDLDRLLSDKKRIILLNKADLADEALNREWQKKLNEQGIVSLVTDCKSGKGLSDFFSKVREILKELLEKRNSKGIKGMPLTIMVLGVPNSGKSSFINRLAFSNRARVEDRPGVTRGKQWINLNNGFELLDMPGILWPKIENPISGLNLAVTGAIKDEIMDSEGLASYLLSFLNENYNQLIKERYKLENTGGLKGYELLEQVAGNRGFLKSGGERNTERAASIVLDEFRGGKIGRITLERP